MPAFDKAIEAFLKHKDGLDEIERNGEESYSIEFSKLREFSFGLKTDPFYSMTEGEKICNIPKNRYKDIVPFDHCRVKLQESSDSESDYINASYIKTPKKQRYIAAQGPLPKTVNDFWSMIWEQNVKVVVMACLEYEGHPPKLKCQRYWNESREEELVFGKISVNLLEESIISGTEDSVTQKTLLASKDGLNKEIIHLHYTKWPDKFIPNCVDSIIKLLQTMRDYHPTEKNEPILIHCSAGCGRTGTLIVLDYVWNLLKHGGITEKFSLYDIILDMRKQRMAIVQSQEQYVFVHEVVARLFKKKKFPESRLNDVAQPVCPAIVQLSSPQPMVTKRNVTGTTSNPGEKQLDSHVYSTISKHQSLNDTPPKSPATKKAESAVYCTVVSAASKPPLPTTSRPVKTSSAAFMFGGKDISYPNRIGKPVGQRPLKC